MPRLSGQPRVPTRRRFPSSDSTLSRPVAFGGEPEGAQGAIDVRARLAEALSDLRHVSLVLFEQPLEIPRPATVGGSRRFQSCGCLSPCLGARDHFRSMTAQERKVQAVAAAVCGREGVHERSELPCKASATAAKLPPLPARSRAGCRRLARSRGRGSGFHYAARAAAALRSRLRRARRLADRLYQYVVTVDGFPVSASALQPGGARVVAVGLSALKRMRCDDIPDAPASMVRAPFKRARAPVLGVTLA